MALGIDQPLLASDMLEVRELKSGKIYLLKGRDGSSVVLKGEGGVTGERIKSAAPIVKAIDRTAKMKVLTTAEVLELKKFLASWRMYVQFVKAVTGVGSNLAIDAAEEKAMDGLERCISDYGAAGAGGLTNIAKLSYASMTTLAIALDVEGKAATDASWEEAREIFARFTKILNKSGGLEKLGQILAGDWFIGNEDRFSTYGGMLVKLYDPQGKRLRIINNLGNVIVVKEKKGKASRPSMLDYMDPASFFSDVGSDVATAERSSGGEWAMRRLLDRARRKETAEKVADDLAYILKPEKSLFGRSKLGGSSAAKRIEDGMKQGMKAIAKTLSGKQGRLTSMMQSALDEMRRA